MRTWQVRATRTRRPPSNDGGAVSDTEGGRLSAAHLLRPGPRLFRWPGPRLLLAVALLLAAGTRAASAQRVSGRLLDVESQAPIPGGTLALLSANHSEIATAVSDADGQWSLEAAEPGHFYIAARRIGYQPWVSGVFELGAGADVTSVFHLRALAIVLDPVEVRAKALRRHLAAAGFYERQRGNFGHFVSPEDIERRQAPRVTDLLTSIPGVNLAHTTGGGAGPTHVFLRGSNLSQGGLCRPRVFVDGLMFSRGDSRPVRVRVEEATERADDQLQRMDQAMSLDDIGHPSTIAAIEIYRSASQVPVQFGGSSVETLCGVIVIWTRTGTMRVGRR